MIDVYRRGMTETLLLFDIDGTLMRGAHKAQIRALYMTLTEIHALEQAEQVLIQTSGRTDLEIARLITAELGITDDIFDSRRDALTARWIELHDQFCTQPLVEQVLPGVPECLTELAEDSQFKFSLVTGNLEPIARRKLQMAELGQFFVEGQGGFGSDHEVRAELPLIARTRAGSDGSPWPQERAIVIGDTPRDIACARADGLKVIAVATGMFTAEDLREADVVIESATELPAALRSL